MSRPLTFEGLVLAAVLSKLAFRRGSSDGTGISGGEVLRAAALACALIAMTQASSHAASPHACRDGASKDSAGRQVACKAKLKAKPRAMSAKRRHVHGFTSRFSQ